MRLTIPALLAVAILASLTILGLSVWPGALVDLVVIAVLSAIVWIPLLLIALSIFLVTLYRSNRQSALPRAYLIQMLAVPTVLFASLALLFVNLPRRLAFPLSRSEFEAMVDRAPQPGLAPSALNSRLGIYWVDQYATDPRGGVYFRTHTGPDGIGPDTMSYGFVNRPNDEGTPFGAAHYGLSHLSGDWYTFQASDDWH